MTQIRVSGRSFELAQYEASPAAFAEELAQAKARGEYPECDCTRPAPKLVIRHVAAGGERPERYFLGCWPYAGAQHARECPFFKSEEHYEQARARLAAAVTRDADGFVIRPDFELRRVLKGEGEAPESPASARSLTPAPATHERPPMHADALSLKETLEYLWHEAGLCAAPAGVRGWAEVHRALRAVAEHGRLGSHRLGKLLYVVPPFAPALADQITAAWSAFSAPFARSQTTVPLFFVLGTVKFNERVGRSVATHLRHHRGALFMSFRLATALASRYPDAEECLIRGGEDAHVVGLYLVEISERGKLWVNDAALLALDSSYVPAAHETAKVSPGLAAAGAFGSSRP